MRQHLDFAFPSPWKMLTQKTNALVRNKPGMWVLQARFLSRNSPLELEEAPLPLWQYVIRLSSPVSMFATHRSLLLMKEKKAGSAGQILGSIRGPVH